MREALSSQGERDDLTRAEVAYSATAFVTPQRLGVSKETTTWCRLPELEGWGMDERMELLDRATYLAATSYAECIERMTLGFLSAKKSRGGGFSLYLSLAGRDLIEIMGFSVLRTETSGEFYHEVERGLLASRHVPLAERGRLYFRWMRQEDEEVFQTEVRDFVPRIAGKGRSNWGLKFYEYTQMAIHRVVMWRYHAWIKAMRSSLMERASTGVMARQLVNKEGSGAKEEREETKIADFSGDLT